LVTTYISTIKGQLVAGDIFNYFLKELLVSIFICLRVW